MNKNYDANRLINEMNELGRIEEAATFSGDYKKGDNAHEKVLDILKLVGDDESFFLNLLKKADNVTMITICCAEMMQLDIKPILARTTLESIIQDEKVPSILRFNISMFLKEWDKGNITKK